MTTAAAILILSTFSAAPAGWLGWDDYGSRYALQLELRPGKAYYVSRRRGDDSAEGVDVDSPLRSLTRACELAEPGDTVIVAPGDVVVAPRPNRRGRDDRHELVAPLPELQRRETSLRLDSCVIRGGRGSGVIAEATRVEIENCEIRANAGDAVRAERVGELTVRRSRIIANQGRGLFLDHCLKSAVEQTALMENGDWAVQSEGVDLRMTNCLIARNAFGLSIASPTRQTTASLWQLTVADNRGEFVGSRRAATATFHTTHYGVLLRGGELELVNSMVTGDGQYGLYRYGGFVRHHHNLFHGHDHDFYGSELSDDEYIAEPRYRDRDKADYRLQRTSRGINQAIEPGARATEDLDGRPRPLFRRSDLGCFESAEQPGVRAILKWQELTR